MIGEETIYIDKQRACKCVIESTLGKQRGNEHRQSTPLDFVRQNDGETAPYSYHRLNSTSIPIKQGAKNPKSILRHW